MTTENLKKTVAILYDIELNIYFMERSIDKIKLSMPDYNDPKPTKRNVKIGKGYAVIVLIISCILGFFCAQCDFFHIEIGIFGCSIIVFISFFLLICLKLLWSQFWADADYEAEIKKYNESLSKAKEKERKLKTQILSLERQKDNSLAKLHQFYNISGINETYRNLIAVGYMKDFLELGICSRLEGVDGLYYAIRKEIRWDKMQETVGDISHKLDASIATQNAIREDLRRMSSRSEAMLSSIANEMKSLSHNQSANAVAAYNSERIRKELEYQNYILRYGR